ncbi:FG-nucleoporin nsp1 [Mycoemilia scoparia]|uniref:FG-nucleoporin nsp1 n=1 Tax=Mycoemilia scoparia TaxID=417184 RepID=A0A9W8A134_9FUNG|nr:FG-nucleoporin nsp1 [Mycoemilia scoparia]
MNFNTNTNKEGESKPFGSGFSISTSGASNAPTKSLFGASTSGSNNTSSSGTGLFGGFSTFSTQNTGSSLFGNASTSTSGTAATSTNTSAPVFGSSGFSGFGNTSSSTTSAPSFGSLSFGNTNTKTDANASTAATSGTTASSLFSQPGAATSSSGASSGLFASFGSNNVSSGFGGTSTATSNDTSKSTMTSTAFGSGSGSTGSGLFGASQTSTSSSVPSFGAATSASTNQTSIFGSVNKDSTSSATTGGSLFGSSGTGIGGSSTSTGGSLFSSQAAKPSDFGSSTNTDKDKPTSLFGNTTASTTAGTSTGATGSSLFGSKTETSKPTESQPAKSTSLFSSFSGGSSTTDNKTATTTAPASSAAAPTGTSLFSSFGNKDSQSSTDSKANVKVTAAPVVSGDATTKTEESKASTTATASKDIPPTSTTILESKTLEDILHTWTSELAEQTRVFQEQAKTVGSWDEILLHQGQNITELYEATVAIEQEQGELDQSIEHMEAQQRALQHLLDGYEVRIRELAEGTSGGPRQGGKKGITSADEEREKAYTMASRLNVHLDELGERLKTVINEVNSSTRIQEGSGASSSGSGMSGPNNANNPLAQIVHILNSHLGALEWIDGQTAQLQSRINQASEVQKQIQSAHQANIRSNNPLAYSNVSNADNQANDSIFATPLASRVGGLSLQSTTATPSNAPPVMSFNSPSVLRTPASAQRTYTQGAMGAVASPFHYSSGTPRRRW